MERWIAVCGQVMEHWAESAPALRPVWDTVSRLAKGARGDAAGAAVGMRGYAEELRRAADLIETVAKGVDALGGAR